MTTVYAVYSESGGVGKTTTAISLAMAFALAGKETLLIDLDPRGASTDWFGIEPKEKGLHVGAILGNDDVDGWAEQLAVPSGWHDKLRVIPSDRSLSNREKDNSQGLELRLKESLQGVEADVVIIDCPNRQGGPLTLSALYAANAVIYAASPTQDGLKGVEGGRRSVAEFRRLRERQGANVTIEEAGIVLGNVGDTVMTRVAKEVIDQLRETDMLLTPIVPARVIVQESRMSGQWYGNYRKGEPVLTAYKEIAEKVAR